MSTTALGSILSTTKKYTDIQVKIYNINNPKPKYLHRVYTLFSKETEKEDMRSSRAHRLTKENVTQTNNRILWYIMVLWVETQFIKLGSSGPLG